MEGWRQGVVKLARVAPRYPQTAYAGMAKLLQSEWQYIQCVVPGMEEAFQPIEDALAS